MAARPGRQPLKDRAYTGGCACGAVRYRARGPARDPCWCHCASCRRAVGASPVAWGTFLRAGFALDAGTLALRVSSAGVERGHCANCGTSLTYASAQRPDEIDVTLATLDEPLALRPTCHLWIEDRLDWGPIEDGLPQYDTVPGRR